MMLLFIRDGLSLPAAQDRYRHRRNELVRLTDRPCVLFSVPHGPGGPSAWVHLVSTMFQEPHFLFLTGLTQYPAALVLAPGEPDRLFLPIKDPKKEFWDGTRFGVGDAQSVEQVCAETGFVDICPIGDLADTVSRLLKDSPGPLGLLWHTTPSGDMIADFNATQNTALLRSLRLDSQDAMSIAPHVLAQRFVLDEADYACMTRASGLSTEAFLATAKQLGACATEYHIAGILSGELLRRSPFGLSFAPIIAAGSHATVLHYVSNDGPLPADALLLCDFGVRWESMHADISRVLPISGRFDPLQRLLYEIVLDTQLSVESQVKAGTTLDQLNTHCWTTLRQLLDTRFTQRGGVATLAYDTQPHQFGHLLGRQVHEGDPYRRHSHMPLQVGSQITNEPGLYGHFVMEIDAVRYDQTIGIRIEDNLWVTADGCINMTAGCPKTVSDIERLLAKTPLTN